jgi:S-adenosylmethionine-diacylgycerolhomoserine-N-methlytransferase
MSDLSHQALMDQTYRHQRRIYDATRAYYLLGRDHLIAELAPAPGAHVLEIACGTGRNLARIGRRYPDAARYGLDISTQMLRSARAKLGPDVPLAQGDACDFDASALFGRAQFDRIVLSYSLSMIPDWQAALEQALAHLAPGGQLHLVDFGTQSDLPRFFRRGLHGWLARFHVTPRHDLQEILQAIVAVNGMDLQYRGLYRSYAQYARITRN